MLETPACVVGAQNLAHDIIAHDVAQLLVEQLPLCVNHRVVGQKVAVALADHRDRLAPPIQVPKQDFALHAGITRALAVGFEEPAGLKAREALIEEALAPFVVGENAHRVIVAELVNNQPDAWATVHDHHREFGAATFDAMHVGDLRPGEFAV